MKPIQKGLIVTGLVIAISAGVFQARRTAHWQNKIGTLTQQCDSLVEQIRKLHQERDETTSKLAAMQQSNDRSRQNVADLPKLRGEATRLRNAAEELARLNGSTAAKATAQASDTEQAAIEDWRPAIIIQIKSWLEQMPESKIPELQFLTDQDWLHAAQMTRLDLEDRVSHSLCNLRSMAKNHFALMMWKALDGYIKTNGGQLPTELSQLKPYFSSPVDDSILQRYQILQKGNSKDLPSYETLIAEKTPVDHDHDSLVRIGIKGISTQKISAAAREREVLMRLAKQR